MDETSQRTTREDGPAGNVAGRTMHLYEVEVEPAGSFEIQSETGPVQRFDIVAANAKDAAEEAERRWRENIRPRVSLNQRVPILIERLGGNVTQTVDAQSDDSWWRRIFR